MVVVVVEVAIVAMMRRRGAMHGRNIHIHIAVLARTFKNDRSVVVVAVVECECCVAALPVGTVQGQHGQAWTADFAAGRVME